MQKVFIFCLAFLAVAWAQAGKRREWWLTGKVSILF